MPSLFTKIRRGEITGFIVTENEEFFALLDRFPSEPGHTLIIPKEEYTTIFDLPDDLYAQYLLFAKKVAAAVQRATQSDRITVVVEGIDIKDHCHIHLIPYRGNKSLEESVKKEATDEELSHWQEKIQAAWREL